MSKYEIVFVDIDDTLNPSNGEVSEHTKEVMKKIKDKGIKVVIDSGRSASYAIKKAIEAGLSEYIISSNGAEVYNYYERKEIFSKPIPSKEIMEIYNYCQEHNMTLILNSMEKRFINIEDFKYDKEPTIYFKDIKKVLRENKINQMVILSTNFDRMLVLPNLFREKFPNLKVVHSSINLIEQKRVKGKEYYHDLVLDNTAKSTGIIELLDYLKIDPKKAIAIGNGYDDIPMFDVVGLRIAVSNANQTLKDIADYVTDSASEEGVANILEKILLK